MHFNNKEKGRLKNPRRTAEPEIEASKTQKVSRLTSNKGKKGDYITLDETAATRKSESLDFENKEKGRLKNPRRTAAPEKRTLKPKKGVVRLRKKKEERL